MQVPATRKLTIGREGRCPAAARRTAGTGRKPEAGQ
jgi:hypothetical protein